MAFTEYKFDPDKIKGQVETRTRNLRENKGFSDLLGFGLKVISDRLAKDRRRYRDYGPYWFALKDILNTSGYSFGDQSDPIVKAVYHGDSDVETLVMADEFRTEYLRTNIVYN
ncbi:MAG: hypothetical protein IPP22_08865, partial [Nitrosomonas sp.]|nr:hypothetical protein [Nitrosomonas sp.]